MLTVSFKANSIGQNGYKYNTFFEGKQIVSKSRTPFYDSCRVLMKMGHSGPVMFIDDEGMPRYTFLDLEKAAQKDLIEHRGANKPTFTLRTYRETDTFDG